MKLGIIQGRLSPPLEGFQECPTDWRREFNLLQKVGLTHIEWIVTKSSLKTNPIFYEDVSSYPISSICADNLVDSRVYDKEYLSYNLRPICEAALKNDIKSVSIPLLEDSSVVDENVREKFCAAIDLYAREYEGLSFLFEAELEHSKLKDILSVSDSFFVTYDTGNMTSCGFDHDEYISAVFNRIKNVHLKDRTYNAVTVPPSNGDTSFKQIFNILRKNNYNGLYTLQTAREIYGNEVETIKTHKQTLEGIYNEKRI
jgi:hexulose-6-phosphate isomerase